MEKQTLKQKQQIERVEKCLENVYSHKRDAEVHLKHLSQELLMFLGGISAGICLCLSKYALLTCCLCGILLCIFSVTIFEIWFIVSRILKLDAFISKAKNLKQEIEEQEKDDKEVHNMD